ncbi:hypothetical protein EV356DRAFT_535594 [Viridothelium virens]|uniref:Uracil phosphoribosyltransferase n=1 Tax=Viridothelium virens TaxID=1048519 RepID=A0A6A6H0E4_VIRVR|nr:hypothetical protein EV356DRAFT_535594 [Viridothelium virens]
MSGTSLSRVPTSSECSFTAIKPIIVGIYGTSGCGKSYLLTKIKEALGDYDFDYFEGSEVLASLFPDGGLDAFKNLAKKEQDESRERATNGIREKCAKTGKTGVVVGHYMFWSEGETKGQVVWTESDQKTFIHIIYFDVPGFLASERRGKDTRSRGKASIEHLEKWRKTEEAALRKVCYDHRILFSRLFDSPDASDQDRIRKVVPLLRHFKQHSEQANTTQAERALDKAFKALKSKRSQLEHLLIVDADKTLAPEDAGDLFWDQISTERAWTGEKWTWREIFKSPMGYSYEAFRQAILVCEEAVDDTSFEKTCQTVADQVKLYPQFRSLLGRIGRYRHVGAVVVTSGLQLVWKKVLEREGLAEMVKVIGGGRISDGFVVTREVRAALTAQVRDTYGLHTWAFGDSPLDLGMLKNAHVAIVVVGEEQARSKSMEAKLQGAIEHDNLEARQVLLSGTVKPRLDTTKLPVMELTDPKFIESIFGQEIVLINASLKNEEPVAQCVRHP